MEIDRLRPTGRSVEMDQRYADGGRLLVTLYYRDVQPPTAFVEVQDTKGSGDHFQVEVPEGVSANEVFHHPFAYRQECYRPAA